MQILFAESALNDLADIKIYYEEQGVAHIGIEFISAIITHIEKLATHPDMGRIVPEFMQEHIRELIHVPFRIVYLRKDKSIQIVRVWRSERLLSMP